MKTFDLKHYIRFYVILYVIISVLLLIPVTIVSLFNSLDEGMRLVFFNLVLVELPGFVVMMSRISAVKKAYRSGVLLPGKLRDGKPLEPSGLLRLDTGERYHLVGFCNFYPMRRHRCRFVTYKRQAWVVEIDCAD